MPSKDEAGDLATAINYLSGYLMNEFSDPKTIDSAVKGTKSDYLNRTWNRIREDVEKIYIERETQTRTLRMLKTVSNAAIMSYFGSYVISVLLIPQLQLLIIHPFTLGIVLLLGMLHPIYKFVKRRKIEEVRGKETGGLGKIDEIIQVLIFHLCDKIRLENKNPRQYKLKLENPDYKGIMVIGKPGLLGGEHYTAFPAIIGAIVAKAKDYIKIVEPWATEKEVFESLFKLGRRVRIQVLISNEIGESRRFRRTWGTIRDRKARNYEVLSTELGELNYRLAITKHKLWKAEKKEWESLKEVKSRKEKEKLEKAFNQKWKEGKSIKQWEEKRRRKNHSHNIFLIDVLR